MKNVVMVVVLALASLFSVGVSAQCYSNTNMIPQGSPPLVLQNGAWCAQGMQSMYNTFGTNPFPAFVGGRQVTMRCSMKDRVVSSFLDAAGTALVLGGIAKLSGSHEANRVAGGGAMVGAGYGATIGCDPMIVDDGDVPARQVSGSQPASLAQRGATISEPSVCAIDGINPIKGISLEDCLKIRGRMTTSAPAEVRQEAGQAGIERKAPAPPQFSGESNGPGVCRLRSDGQARLASNPAKALSRGEVIAVSESTSDSADATVIARENDEDCRTWSRRVANKVVWKG